LLKPLPLAEPDALLAVGQNNSQNRARLSQFSFRNFADFRDRSQSFERLGWCLSSGGKVSRIHPARDYAAGRSVTFSIS
jgi:hypothetical protein